MNTSYNAVGAAILLGCTAVSACSDTTTAPPSTAPLAVTVRFCSTLAPSWVAFQDGDGAWTRALPSGSGSTIGFHSDFSSNRGAIATLSGSGGGLTILSVQYGTPPELVAAGDTNARDCGSPVSKALLGTVAGLDTNEFAFISSALSSRTRVLPATGDTFALKGLPGGPQDLLATRTTRTSGIEATTRMIVRRNVDLPDSTTLPVFDFGSSEAFAPAVANVSLSALGSDGATGATRLLTSHDDLPVTFQTTPTTNVTRPYVALPEAQLLPGDLQALFATVLPTTTGDGRTATLYFRAPTDRALTFGAPLARPTFTTVATTPTLRLGAHYVSQSDYDRSATISYQQGLTTIVTLSMTAAYSVVAGGYDILIPDLSSVAGFDPAWALHAGGPVQWTAGRIGGTLGLGRDAVPGDGATMRTAFGTDTIP